MNFETLGSRLLSAREPLLWMLAIGAAIATGFGARAYLKSSEADARAMLEQRFRPVSVVVARSDLVPGSQLAPEMLAVRNMPQAFLPASSVRATHAGDVVGRTVAHAVRAGEPIQTPLLKARTDTNLSGLIALGRRGVTIPVDEASAVAGLLQPGDRVDLRWRGGGPALLNVPVLATGSRLATADGGEADYSTLTLELAEADARRLAESTSSGLRVMLRNPSDTGDSELVRALAKPAAPAVTIPLIVGGGGGPVPSLRLLAEGAP
jgi:Flp pilus assembly protein CpaB